MGFDCSAVLIFGARISEELALQMTSQYFEKQKVEDSKEYVDMAFEDFMDMTLHSEGVPLTAGLTVRGYGVGLYEHGSPIDYFIVLQAEKMSIVRELDKSREVVPPTDEQVNDFKRFLQRQTFQTTYGLFFAAC